MTGTRRPSRLRALLRGRCPECGIGRIFAGRTRMNERCPECGYRFEHEPGYFTGAMYFSYAIAVPIIAAGVIAGSLWIVPTWPLHWVLVAAWVLFLPLVPAVFRASRVLFIHLDRFLDPEGEAR
ncbi:DUF983 domain-containing protein [Tundrisphaera sp. TA3]|uniref:DUF983 domain-containing protein n=1 Tax=Tundrisphaera sp. TA3 TaxID=3435775 RepID=UPI003EBAB838